MSDWLVIGQVVKVNPSASVRGPRFVVKKGKTPMLDASETRQLLDAIDVSHIVDLRDRAIIAAMVYSFARVGTMLTIKVEKYYTQGRRDRLRLHEKGGNSLKSSGLKTLEGKARSRANSLKHGLTGERIVLPNEDVEEIDRRFDTLQEEMNPKNEMARQLILRVALMTFRLERSAVNEARMISHRMRQAVAEFDDERLAEVEKLYSWIAAEPATNARRLRSTRGQTSGACIVCSASFERSRPKPQDRSHDRDYVRAGRGTGFVFPRGSGGHWRSVGDRQGSRSAGR